MKVWRTRASSIALASLIAGAAGLGTATPATAAGRHGGSAAVRADVTVSDEAGFRAAFADPAETQITLGGDLSLTDCGAGTPTRDSATGLTIVGNGHTVAQTCAHQRVLAYGGGGTLTLDGVTVTGGAADVPGSAEMGGGIYGSTQGAALTLTDSTVTANTATLGGGGMFISGPVTLSRSAVTDNAVTTDVGPAGQGNGGGIAADTVTASNSEITGNTTKGFGGGIDTETRAGGAASLDHTDVSHNTALQDGGAVYAGAITATDSSIDDNQADQGGGLWGLDQVTITSTTVSNNRARRYGNGGGIFSGGTISVTNSTVTGNSAVSDGNAHPGAGGILAEGYQPAIAGSVTLIYSTVTNNSGPSGRGANVEVIGPDADDVLHTFGSVIAQPQGGGNCNLTQTTASQGDNFSDDSSCGFSASTDHENAGDPGLGALADNGGAAHTQTLLPAPTSPLVDAIAAGDCQAGGAAGVSTDERGVTRPQGDGCDIGAVERPAVPAPTIDSPVPTSLVAAASPTAFDATITNAGAPRANVRVDFALSGMAGLAANQVSLEYRDGTTWRPISLRGTGSISGSYPSATGFVLPSGETTIPLRISLADDVKPGTVNLTTKLDTVDGSGTVTKTLAQASGSSKVSGPGACPVGAGSSQAVVRWAYMGLLLRCPDNIRVTYWSDYLDHGGSQATFANTLARSDESLADWVETAYVEVFDRDVDSAGLTYWRNQLTHGLRWDRMVAGLVGSNEFWNAANHSNRQFVINTYRAILLRDPDPGGLAYWTNLLNHGLSRTSFAWGLTSSYEHDGDWVVGAYNELLNRDPTDPEFVFVTYQLHQVGNPWVIYGGLASSAEFKTVAGQYVTPSATDATPNSTANDRRATGTPVRVHHRHIS